MSGRSVLDEAIAGSGRVGDLHHELEALQHAMGDPAQRRTDGRDSRALRRSAGRIRSPRTATRSKARRAKCFYGLGFDDERIDGDVGELSGGWKMRVAMARVLLGRPDVLLMDEPTNHLDIESIVWLEDFIKSLPGALLMTSHDREFMNRVVTKLRKSMAAKSPSTPATTISIDENARFAKRIAKPLTRDSRRCWPKNSDLSNDSPRTPPKPRRFRAV